MTRVPVYVDTKTIIVNLLKEDKKTYLPIDRLIDLLDYIYEQLQEQNKLEDYQIMFDVYFDAIERTVIYNNNLFALDTDDNTIYLKDRNSFDTVTNCKFDDTINSIVKKFSKQFRFSMEAV